MDLQEEMARALQIWVEGQLGVPAAQVATEPLMDGGVVLRVSRGSAAEPFAFRIPGGPLQALGSDGVLDLLERGRRDLRLWVDTPDCLGARVHLVEGAGHTLRAEK